MRVRILLQITAEDETFGEAQEIACFEKTAERAEQLGLSLAEGKLLLAAVQLPVVQAQVGLWTERHRECKACGVRRKSKGSYPVLFRTLYGDVPLASPRLHRCACQSAGAPATHSPLCDLLPGHIARTTLPGVALGIPCSLCGGGRLTCRCASDSRPGRTLPHSVSIPCVSPNEPRRNSAKSNQASSTAARVNGQRCRFRKGGSLSTSMEATFAIGRTERQISS